MQRKILIYCYLFILGMLALGMMNCTASRKIALDPESEEFYEYARLIMTDPEKTIFRHLPDAESRKGFIKEFWEKRDPDLDTEENEFKSEFYQRIDYANQRFREGPPGWKTDRGRIYIYLGFPDKIDEFHTHGLADVRGPILWWIYYRYGFAVKFLDKNNIGHYTLDPYSGIYGNLFDAIELAKFGFVSPDEFEAKKIVDFDLEYDKEKKEFVISIPAKSLIFRDEDGILKADFEFKIFVYEQKGTRKDRFQETRTFAKPEEEVVELKIIEFFFPYDLLPGKYYVDVVIIGKLDIGKTRKIFKIKNL